MLKPILIKSDHFKKTEISKANSRPRRSNVGGVVITINKKQPVLISAVQLHSNITKTPIKLIENWDFFIERESNGISKIFLDNNNLDHKFKIKNLNNKLLDFEFENNRIFSKTTKSHESLTTIPTTPSFAGKRQTPVVTNFDNQFLFDEQTDIQNYDTFMRHHETSQLLDLKR